MEKNHFGRGTLHQGKDHSDFKSCVFAWGWVPVVSDWYANSKWTQWPLFLNAFYQVHALVRILVLVQVHPQAPWKRRWECVWSVEDLAQKSVLKKDQKFKRPKWQKYHRASKESIKNRGFRNESKGKVILRYGIRVNKGQNRRVGQTGHHYCKVHAGVVNTDQTAAGLLSSFAF